LTITSSACGVGDGVDDAVTQASMWLLLLDKRVGVHSPVHGAIANSAGSTGAFLVE
jgi:hypothetical protein